MWYLSQTQPYVIQLLFLLYSNINTSVNQFIKHISQKNIFYQIFFSSVYVIAYDHIPDICAV